MITALCGSDRPVAASARQNLRQGEAAQRQSAELQEMPSRLPVAKRGGARSKNRKHAVPAAELRWINFNRLTQVDVFEQWWARRGRLRSDWNDQQSLNVMMNQQPVVGSQQKRVRVGVVFRGMKKSKKILWRFPFLMRPNLHKTCGVVAPLTKDLTSRSRALAMTPRGPSPVPAGLDSQFTTRLLGRTITGGGSRRTGVLSGLYAQSLSAPDGQRLGQRGQTLRADLCEEVADLRELGQAVKIRPVNSLRWS